MLKALSNSANIFLLAGANLLFVFIILGGSVNHFPFNDFWFVKADTSDISNAYPESGWYFWGVCNIEDKSQCNLGAAYPIEPSRNFQTTDGVPQDFTSGKKFYYLSRFGFAFLLIAFVFTALAFLINLCGFYLESIEKIGILLVTLATLFDAGACAFYTSVAVLARNAFKDDGKSTKVGAKSFGILWASLVTLLIIWFTLCATNIVNSYRKHVANVRGFDYNNDYYNQQNGAEGGEGQLADDSSFTRSVPVEKEDNTGSGGIRFFRIKRNQKQPSDEESV